MFPFKPDDVALGSVKFHTDKIDVCTTFTKCVGIAFLPDLRQSCSRGFVNVHYFEFKNVNLIIVQLDGHINAAMAGGILRGHIKAKGRKIAVEDRGIVPLIFGKLVFPVPVMGDRRKKSLKNRFERIGIFFPEKPGKF